MSEMNEHFEKIEKIVNYLFREHAYDTIAKLSLNEIINNAKCLVKENAQLAAKMAAEIERLTKENQKLKAKYKEITMSDAESDMVF